MCFQIQVPFCRMIRHTGLLITLLMFFGTSHAEGTSGSSEKDLVARVIAAAGGEESLLKLFRMEERYNSGKERISPGTSRVSVVEPPKSWWIGTKERGTEPAKITTWAWTLGVLNDPQSKLELLPDITEGEKTLTGLRISESVDPAIDMYFDKTTFELVRVDWRNDIYRFSEWKDFDGTRYPARCAMFRRNSGEPWFFHEIVAIERLKELPEGLKR
ncbi:MAG: hypothetical protein U0936_10665 [Planctomycetaceae bacterium]